MMHAGGIATIGAGAPWALSPKEIETWGANARPGDRLTYAHGALNRQARDAARALYDAGVASLNQARGADGLGDYILTRRAPRVRDHAAPSPRDPIAALEARRLPNGTDRLLGVLRRCAEQNQVCPTTTILAERAELYDSSHAQQALERLVGRGAIAIKMIGRRRHVFVACLGRWTKRPGEGDQ